MPAPGLAGPSGAVCAASPVSSGCHDTPVLAASQASASARLDCHCWRRIDVCTTHILRPGRVILIAKANRLTAPSKIGRSARPERLEQNRPFRGSSAVEQPAVNRLVAGSNPARGASPQRGARLPHSPISILRRSEIFAAGPGVLALSSHRRPVSNLRLSSARPARSFSGGVYPCGCKELALRARLAISASILHTIRTTCCGIDAPS